MQIPVQVEFVTVHDTKYKGWEVRPFSGREQNTRKSLATNHMAHAFRPCEVSKHWASPPKMASKDARVRPLEGQSGELRASDWIQKTDMKE